MQISISILRKSLEKEVLFHTKSGSPQKSSNICVHFRAHQDRLTFLGEAYGLLDSHLEQSLLSGKPYSRAIYLCMEWLNEEENIFLSPKKHKEIKSSSCFVKHIAKHITKAARITLNCSQHLKQF